MYITWKGITSDTQNVIINSMPFVTPEERLELSESEGRDGGTYTGLGYAPYVLPCKITLLPSADIDVVKAWLTGSSTLLRSDDPLKKQSARISSKIDYEKMASTREAQIDFIISDPYRYLLSEADQTITSTPATVVNGGTAISWPLLKITGSGTVTITLNGISFTYIFDTPYVYIDCIDNDSRNAYHESVLKNRKKTGGWPYLNVGNNTLTYTGSVTEIVITKRTRYI